mmetsp:Transcript_93322/g.279962  ORF Transcript_93322/g.279962 Transcript_93322/m.279962 type:complete len:237 (+) Transcript_93322:986-1696(+)
MRRRPWRANSRRAMWSSARWRPARSRRSGRRCASRSCRRRWTVCVRRSRHSSSRAARATWPSHTRGATQPRACGDASAVRGSRAERRRVVRRRRCCWSAHWSCGTRSGCCLVLCTPSAHRCGIAPTVRCTRALLPCAQPNAAAIFDPAALCSITTDKRAIMRRRQTLHTISGAIQSLLASAPQLLFREFPQWSTAALASKAEARAMQLHQAIAALYEPPVANDSAAEAEGGAGSDM